MNYSISTRSPFTHSTLEHAAVGHALVERDRPSREAIAPLPLLVLLSLKQIGCFTTE
ncbi:hypothetical protein H6G00_14230 [Leptolyngbya sp. FACHB-541]|uniref:hypothetical protein n=1 Tax=Leptolyngbya sp. FACHB-541 TaxID=2692810 RepID=UPI00168591A3|nr:hypothetical protein [Leptolyngbya sp. FACHB-541]MBD1997771.1 hypothetical protein [Leptolyngbya sp. FACHB-541]